jgi:uncharacterized glyoxalase superfamily protein PhnB
MSEEICIPYLRVKDARASLAYYEHCLGFRKLSEHRFAPDLPLCIGIQRGKLRFFLTEHRGDGPFGICVYCFVDDDIDEMFKRCRANGAIIGHEPEDMPWARDFTVKDLDGNTLRFGKKRGG